MSFLDSLKQHLDSDVVGSLAAKVGIDPQQAKAAVDSALPAIVSALAKNTASGDGAQKLDKALVKHDGGVLATLGASAPDLLKEGEKILGHVFGKKQATAESHVAGAAAGSGLDAAKVGDLLKTLAPVVLSALSQKKKADGLDASGLASQLQADGQQAKSESGGALSFLDADGDGDVMDDLADKGKGLLGSLGGLFGGSSDDKPKE